MAPSCAPPGIGDTKPFFIAAAGLSDTANLSGSQQPFGRIADKVAGIFCSGGLRMARLFPLIAATEN